MLSKPHEPENWDLVIEPKKGGFSLHFREVWAHKDLISMLVKRDVVTIYKQTVLGPIWFIVQPILTTIVFMFIFGQIAGISTDGVPQVLFYLSGITIWNYFSESFRTTAKTFKENEDLFGKVYFPRIIVPISKIISGLLKFSIQFAFLLVIYTYLLLTESISVFPNIYFSLFPILLIIMAGIGLGFGIIFTSLTVKYRDLIFLIEFGVQLLMYATPVIYPISAIPEKYRSIILANPISGVVETFRYILLGSGSLNIASLIYSFVFMISILFLGILIFNRTEKDFMDTI